MTISLTSQNIKEKCDPAFAREIQEKTGAHLERCYQCMACSSGCPVAYEMDYPPHQILRMTQLGLKEMVLKSTTIWLCASCETCATRCPNEIEIVQIMDLLRETAIKEGHTEQTPLPLFHNTFLGGIRFTGKAYELGLILQYTLASGNIFKLKKMLKDMVLGAKMFTKGRLAILPSRIKGVTQVQRIFQQTKKGNG